MEKGFEYEGRLPSEEYLRIVEQEAEKKEVPEDSHVDEIVEGDAQLLGLSELSSKGKIPRNPSGKSPSQKRYASGEQIAEKKAIKKARERQN